MRARRATGLLLGVLADSAFGERARRKPVIVTERIVRVAESKLADDHPAVGALYAGGVAAGATMLGVCAERIGRRDGLLHIVTTALATWLVLGTTALAVEGSALARDLETGELDDVRKHLSGLDPRCTEDLDTVDLARASVETVAKHTAEGVVAPLLWGAFGGVGGLAGARSVTLLRRLPARRGWLRELPVLVDDVVQLLPARAAAALTVVGAPIVGGSAAAAWRAWRRDTFAHPSPNAGRVEAAFAGALEIRLGGRTVYPHGQVELPVLGDGRNPDAGHVTRAVELSRVVGWLAGLGSVALTLAAGLRRR